MSHNDHRSVVGGMFIDADWSIICVLIFTKTLVGVSGNGNVWLCNRYG